MILSSKLSMVSIKCNPAVRDFSEKALLNPNLSIVLERSKCEFQQSLVFEMFNFKQIGQQLGYCLKLCRENQGSLHDSLKKNVEQMLDFPAYIYYKSVNTEISCAADVNAV